MSWGAFRFPVFIAPEDVPEDLPKPRPQPVDVQRLRKDWKGLADYVTAMLGDEGLDVVIAIDTYGEFTMNPKIRLHDKTLRRTFERGCPFRPWDDRGAIVETMHALIETVREAHRLAASEHLPDRPAILPAKGADDGE